MVTTIRVFLQPNFFYCNIVSLFKTTMVVDRMLCSVESPLCTRLQQTFDIAPPIMVSICTEE
jgi:hypothetical protein